MVIKNDDNLVEKLVPKVLSSIRSRSKPIESLVTKTDMTGVTSMPCYDTTGGQFKKVLVPIDVLRGPVLEASEVANNSAKKAIEAAATANNSAEKANEAAIKVTDAILDLSSEKEYVTSVVDAESDRVSAEIRRIENEEERTDAESLRNLQEGSRQSAEIVRDANEKNRVSQETTRQSNENTRKSNESTRVSQESERVSSEKERVENETERQTAESSRVSAENTRVSSEKTRINNENSRVAAEKDRENHETIRQSAETVRDTNEKNRVSQETTRQSNENTRKSNESTRVSQESERVSSEKERVENETERQTAESSRASAENTRVSSEKTRVNNENSRVAAEKDRASEFSNLKAESELATAKALDTAYHPTYIGEDNYVYVWDLTSKTYNKTDVYVRGESFSIRKVYNSVDEMYHDTSTSFKEGDFCLINTGNVEDPDNALLYVRSSIGSWDYLVDMSGAIGFTGKTPQLSIGTVTTGANKSSASVTMASNGIDENGNPRYKINYVVPSLAYEDLTKSQIEDLQQPANEMIVKLEETDETVKSNEALRVTAENKRVSSENSRVSAESSRVSDESSRQLAESERVLAERQRAEQFQIWSEDSTKHPYIGDNHNWWVWNPSLRKYEDSGILAQGGFVLPVFSIQDNMVLTLTSDSDYSTGTFEYDSGTGNLLFVRP